MFNTHRTDYSADEEPSISLDFCSPGIFYPGVQTFALDDVDPFVDNHSSFEVDVLSQAEECLLALNVDYDFLLDVLVGMRSSGGMIFGCLCPC